MIFENEGGTLLFQNLAHRITFSLGKEGPNTIGQEAIPIRLTYKTPL